jgi:hypothetical protein
MPTFALVDESPTEQTRIVVIQDPTEKCPWHNRPVNRVDYNRIKKQIEPGKSAVSEVEERLKSRTATGHGQNEG